MESKVVLSRRTVLIICFVIISSLRLSPVWAIPIPIEEEFVLAQQIHVDASWEGIVITCLQEEGLLDICAPMYYAGIYTVSQSPSGDFFGAYSGILTGMYLGEYWTIAYAADMVTETLISGEKVKKWGLKSSGEWKKGDFKGKKFEDKGTLTEKENNKADLDLEITTEGEAEKITQTIKDLDKSKADGKLTVTGDIKIKDKKGKEHTETLTLILDQDKKTFTSKLKSGGWLVLKNEGTFTNHAPPTPGMASFNLHVVPEPSTLFLLGSGLAGLVGFGRKRLFTKT